MRIGDFLRFVMAVESSVSALFDSSTIAVPAATNDRMTQVCFLLSIFKYK